MGVDDMKISFLVTYYNQKEFVKKSLDSILAIEKPCDWEIIVGDDGSTDGTIDIVNEYIKLYPDKIRLYIMPRENGKKYDSVKRASANRLNILEKSDGDFYCTIDGDDYYCDSSFVVDAIDVFSKYKDVSVVAFGFQPFRDDVFEEPILLPEKLTDHVVDKAEYLREYYVHAGGCVYRRCFADDRIEYIKTLGFFDDNNIVINSLNYGDMYVVNRAVYAYRQTGQSIYTSMSGLEQAVLNVQGMDVDLRLVDDSLKNLIIERYSAAVIVMYIWRKKLRSTLGDDKFKKYMDGCDSLKPSYCNDILLFASSGEKTNNVKLLMKNVGQMKRKYMVKQYIKYLLGRNI